MLALVISVFFRYWHWRIKIHLVFGNFDIPSSWFTVSLEIFGEKFCISSGVRAQQLERYRGAHVFASNTLDVLSVAIDLGPGLQWRDRAVLVHASG